MKDASTPSKNYNKGIYNANTFKRDYYCNSSNSKTVANYSIQNCEVDIKDYQNSLSKKTTAQKETPVEKVEQTEVEVTPVVEEKAALVVVAPKVEEVADNQVKLSDIVRIIRQSPHYTEVLLKSGDTAQFSTSDFDKLRNPEDDTNVIRYM